MEYTPNQMRLVARLRALSFGEVRIKIVNSEPVAAYVYKSKSLGNQSSESTLTAEETLLLDTIRSMEHGQLSIRIVGGRWIGDIIEDESYTQWELGEQK